MESNFSYFYKGKELNLMKANHCLGTLVANNTGKIQNCYSTMCIKHATKAKYAAMFGINQGSIQYCIFGGQIHQKSKHAMLVGKNDGQIQDSFWLETKKQITSPVIDERFRIEKNELAQKVANWNLEQFWQISDDQKTISLKKQKVKVSGGESIFEIKQEKDLLRLMKEGFEPHIKYILMKNMDLGGRTIQPIGQDIQHAFAGCFDGNGYTIQNFKIQSKNHGFAGLFGVIAKNGAVVNLNLDGVAGANGEVTGLLCAYNQGYIRNCHVKGKLGASKYTGGLVGQNAGWIDGSSSDGVIDGTILIWWILLPFIWILTFLIPLLFYWNGQKSYREVFAPVIVDPNAKPIQSQNIPADPQNGQITSTSQNGFIMNSSMEVSIANYVGRIGLKCPSAADSSFVARIYVQKQDLNRLGFSGIDQDVLVYQSGLIQPGYGIETIALEATIQQQSLPIGEYEMVVHFDFYDTQTNEKRIVDSTIPLHVTIR